MVAADATKLLYNNVYGWFDRVGTGRYCLTAAGIAAAQEWRTQTSQAG